MKTLVRILLVLVLLLAAGVFLGATYAGSLVRKAVEKGGTHVLGVETKLADASLGLFAGKLGLGGLTVAKRLAPTAPTTGACCASRASTC